jgi:hypothetical protein
MVKSKGVHSSPASSGSSGQGPRLLGWRSVEYTWAPTTTHCLISNKAGVQKL